METFVGRHEVYTSRYHHEGRNDYSKSGTDIVAVVDKDGRPLQPVWGERWTKIARGVETRHWRSSDCVRIAAKACPVRIRIREWSEYVSHADLEHCSRSATYTWVEYVGTPLSWRQWLLRIIAPWRRANATAAEHDN